MKTILKQLLREALGVPKNLTKLAELAYDEFLERIKRELPNDNGFGGFKEEIYLRGNFWLGDFSFNKIIIELNIKDSKGITEPKVYSMANSNRTSLDSSNMQIKNENLPNEIRLNVKVAVNQTNTNIDIIDVLSNERQTYITWFAHELMHAYDAYKKTNNNLSKRIDYEVAKQLQFGIKPLDDFFYNLYFIHDIENVVRPSEIASGIEINNVSKKDFIEFLMKNETYVILKKINSLTMSDFIRDLIAESDTIKETLKRSNVQVPRDIPDTELVIMLLNLIFDNVRHMKINELRDYLSRHTNPLKSLLGIGNDEERFQEFYQNYIIEMGKFKTYDEFYNYEFKNNKHVTDMLLKKIHKLYAMAKDDEKVSDLMQKINARGQQTNESEHIFDRDLYSELEKIPVTKIIDFLK
jgi:hypothetical protein